MVLHQPVHHTIWEKKQRKEHDEKMHIEGTLNAREFNSMTVENHGTKSVAQPKRKQRQNSKGLYPLLSSLQAQLTKALFILLGSRNSCLIIISPSISIVVMRGLKGVLVGFVDSFCWTVWGVCLSWFCTFFSLGREAHRSAKGVSIL